MRQFKKIIIYAVFICIAFSSVTVSALSCESRYFKINVADSIDLYEVLSRLNIRSYLHVDTATKAVDTSLTGILKENMDTLYLEVSDCLDIHLHGFKINLIIVPDNAAMLDMTGPVEEDIGDRGAYYDEQKNTIYISFRSLAVSPLAYKIAEAVIAHYFVIPPPEKFRNILSGYVEKTVNRITDVRR